MDNGQRPKGSIGARLLSSTLYTSLPLIVAFIGHGVPGQAIVAEAYSALYCRVTQILNMYNVLTLANPILKR